MPRCQVAIVISEKEEMRAPTRRKKLLKGDQDIISVTLRSIGN